MYPTSSQAWRHSSANVKQTRQRQKWHHKPVSARNGQPTAANSPSRHHRHHRRRRVLQAHRRHPRRWRKAAGRNRTEPQALRRQHEREIRHEHRHRRHRACSARRRLGPRWPRRRQNLGDYRQVYTTGEARLHCETSRATCVDNSRRAIHHRRRRRGAQAAFPKRPPARAPRAQRIRSSTERARLTRRRCSNNCVPTTASTPSARTTRPFGG